MKYAKSEAKDYARKHLTGIWAAALTPFRDDLAIDEEGFRANLRHWVDDLKLGGLFISGKQAEYTALSLDERKRLMQISVEETAGKSGTIMSCSDQSFDTVVELGRYAQDIGADFIIVHAPVLFFTEKQDETVYGYYKALSERLDIGIAMWSHPDSGYLVTPETCARIADLPNIVGIKYSVPRPMYTELTRLAGDRIQVSTASEAEWLDNILELNWNLYLCSTPPYLLQSSVDQRMNEYTALAMRGEVERARAVSASLQPVRDALKRTRPPEKPQAHQKYWQELLGQAGGPVRFPQLQLTEAEKAATRAAFEACGLKVAARAAA